MKNFANSKVNKQSRNKQLLARKCFLGGPVRTQNQPFTGVLLKKLSRKHPATFSGKRL